VDAVAEFWDPDIIWRPAEGAIDDVGEMHGPEAVRRYTEDFGHIPQGAVSGSEKSLFATFLTGNRATCGRDRLDLRVANRTTSGLGGCASSSTEGAFG
jgi:hypothetical protein